MELGIAAGRVRALEIFEAPTYGIRAYRSSRQATRAFPSKGGFRGTPDEGSATWCLRGSARLSASAADVAIFCVAGRWEAPDRRRPRRHVARDVALAKYGN